MTRIIGVLSWFDESPTWLASTVASLARVCDHVVAIDGRYALYDDHRVVSEMVQHDAITHTARGAGIGCTLVVPTEPWDDEMHKRTACFQHASLLAEKFEDWVLVIDGDEVLVEAPSRDTLRSTLADAAEQNVWTGAVTLRDVADPHENPERTKLGMKLPVAHAIETTVPRLFRVGERMRVVGYHYNYVAENGHGDPVEYWGHDGAVEHRTAWTLETKWLTLEHRQQQRNKLRSQVRETYYQERNETQLETIAPLSELEHDLTGATA